MATRTCTQCGNTLEDKAKFCGRCGHVQSAGKGPFTGSGARTLLALPAPKPVGAPTSLPAAKRTIVGLPSLGGTLVQAAQAAQAAKAAAAANPSAPVEPEPAPQAAPADASAEAAAPRNGAPGTGGAPHMRRTMLGVAMPGIAPLRNGSDGAVDGRGATVMLNSPELPPARPVRSPARPMNETVPIPAFFVPPPAPIPQAAPPAAPVAARRPGAPLFVAALIAGGVALVGGAAIAVLWHGAPPIAAQPRIAPDGRDLLHLTCDTRSCADGTVVSLEGVKASFLGGEADLPLPGALRVGDNQLALSIDRPGMGRDETVKLVVPVAYRVRADITTMDSPHPSITIRVEAPSGTEVRVEDTPVVLDASGRGAFVVDESSMVDGPADESRVIAIDVPYVVTPRGHASESGTVSARIGVAPLRVDAPGPSTITDEDTLLIAGRAAKGAQASVNGMGVSIGADGAFETKVAVGTLGTHTIDVRAGTALLAPRTVSLSVTRVGSLAEAAKAFEARDPIGYDAAMRDITAARTGEAILVEGDVLEARGSGHSTLVLIDDHRGCSRGPCIARVVVGRDMTLSHGESLRAFGRVARAFRTSSGQTVPEVEAEFVTRAKP